MLGLTEPQLTTLYKTMRTKKLSRLHKKLSRLHKKLSLLHKKLSLLRTNQRWAPCGRSAWSGSSCCLPPWWSSGVWAGPRAGPGAGCGWTLRSGSSLATGCRCQAWKFATAEKRSHALKWVQAFKKKCFF